MIDSAEKVTQIDGEEKQRKHGRGSDKKKRKRRDTVIPQYGRSGRGAIEIKVLGINSDSEIGNKPRNVNYIDKNGNRRLSTVLFREMVEIEFANAVIDIDRDEKLYPVRVEVAALLGKIYDRIGSMFERWALEYKKSEEFRLKLEEDMRESQLEGMHKLNFHVKDDSLKLKFEAIGSMNWEMRDDE